MTPSLELSSSLLMSEAGSTKLSEIPPEQRLQVPTVPLHVYPTNYTKTVVCELKIPTLVEIETNKLKSFTQALRKRFPLYSPVTDIQMTPGAPGTSEANHRFARRDRSCVVVLRRSSLLLESSKYKSFASFREDLELVASAAVKLIEADFFTRVGLRYINLIPVGQPVGEWINPLLTSVIDSGALGFVRQHMTEVRGVAAEDGEFSLRYGFPPQRKEKDGRPRYVIDLDFFALSVDLGEMLPLVDRLRMEANNLFEWCIGPRTRDAMSNSLT